MSKNQHCVSWVCFVKSSGTKRLVPYVFTKVFLVKKNKKSFTEGYGEEGKTGRSSRKSRNHIKQNRSPGIGFAIGNKNISSSSSSSISSIFAKR